MTWTTPIDAIGRRFTKALPTAEHVEIEGASHGLLTTHTAEPNEVLLTSLPVGRRRARISVGSRRTWGRG